MSTALQTRTVMPAEWSRHARTWMEFPVPSGWTEHGFGPGFGPEGSPELTRAQRCWAAVANAISGYEPVSMLVPAEYLEQARRLLLPGVRVHEAPTENAWLRDSGPTFVHTSDGSLRAVNWVFNGWGSAHLLPWDAERHVAGTVAGVARTPVDNSPLVLEGGAVHVDGEGTVLITETVALDPNRNPGWTRAEVEAELHSRLGTRTAIWLPQGLTGDHGALGTQGHVDMLATFARPGVVLVHQQTDPEHPDYLVSLQTIELLRQATDAQGRRLCVIPLPAPRVRDVDGYPCGYSYVNHYLANGVVVLGVFDDPADTLAGQLLRRVYRGREVLMLDAREIFANGGGIHSITQQQPAPLCRPGGPHIPRPPDPPPGESRIIPA